MSDIDDGGPAFPIPGMDMQSLGLTMRDYFAAKAMQGLIQSFAHGEFRESVADGILIRPAHIGIPPIAYAYADAMLEARKK